MSLALTSSRERFTAHKAARGTWTPWQGKGTLAVVENIFQELFTLGRGLQLEHSDGVLDPGSLQNRVNLHTQLAHSGSLLSGSPVRPSAARPMEIPSKQPKSS